MNEHSDNERDAILIQRAQEGDSDAFDILLARYKPLVRARAATMFIPGSDHDDVVQEGMIGLFKAIRDYHSNRGARFSTFAARCVIAQITDAIRAAQRNKHRPMNDSMPLQFPHSGPDSGEEALRLLDVYVVPGEEGPEERIISQEASQAIEQFISNELTPLERDAIRLLLAHRTYREAAAVLGRDEKAIDNAVRRARKKFLRYYIWMNNPDAGGMPPQSR